METAIAQAFAALIQIWANHTNKPPGWQPTAQDFVDLLAKVDAATPEARKAAARERAGISSEDLG